ncbi:UNKNOWN [Stylonychia lemnae]|uniref:Uncharacterized protein n=1 Tax=Stylonychia lemnae TaxID=5949 RepID=A0A078A3W5_STYLE|nr:UNKNOWN [Stylonychia lemnae]|eukprot:CDW75449.1 UNKNOWN [Stylonychia lemnae]
MGNCCTTYDPQSETQLELNKISHSNLHMRKFKSQDQRSRTNAPGGLFENEDGMEDRDSISPLYQLQSPQVQQQIFMHNTSSADESNHYQWRMNRDSMYSGTATLQLKQINSVDQSLNTSSIHLGKEKGPQTQKNNIKYNSRLRQQAQTMYRENNSVLKQFDSTTQNKQRNQSLDSDLNDLLFGVSNVSDRRFDNSPGRKDKLQQTQVLNSNSNVNSQKNATRLHGRDRNRVQSLYEDTQRDENADLQLKNLLFIQILIFCIQFYF